MAPSPILLNMETQLMPAVCAGICIQRRIIIIKDPAVTSLDLYLKHPVHTPTQYVVMLAIYLSIDNIKMNIEANNALRPVTPPTTSTHTFGSEERKDEERARDSSKSTGWRREMKAKRTGADVRIERSREEARWRGVGGGVGDGGRGAFICEVMQMKPWKDGRYVLWAKRAKCFTLRRILCVHVLL